MAFVLESHPPIARAVCFALTLADPALFVNRIRMK